MSLEKEINQKIIDNAINILEKDALVMKAVTELPFMLLNPGQREILLGLSKLSLEIMESLKQVKL